MAYTYGIPIAIQQQLVAVLRSNGQIQLAEMISAAKLDFDDVGLAYYAGLKGNNWDKHALDCNIYVVEKNMADIQRMKGVLKNWIQKLLPHDTGLLVRDISVIPRIEDENITLPETHGETWEVLHTDIMQALSRNEPTLVLDRLHTFSVKFIRELCDKKGIQTKDTNGKAYALHSLGGMLLKYYHANNVFQSVFSEQALKTSISLFDRYNSVRNDQSYAHDNDVLNKAEATLAKENSTVEIVGQYINSKTKIACRCCICGNEWEMRPNALLRGQGCPKCGRKRAQEKSKKTHEQFVIELGIANSKVDLIGKYHGSDTKISVRCRKCGLEWDAWPSELLAGHGCSVCYKSRKRTQAQFIEELYNINPQLEVLGQYINANTKLEIRCRKCGREWRACPHDLLRGHGCAICAKEKHKSSK